MLINKPMDYMPWTGLNSACVQQCTLVDSGYLSLHSTKGRVVDCSVLTSDLDDFVCMYSSKTGTACDDIDTLSFLFFFG